MALSFFNALVRWPASAAATAPPAAAIAAAEALVPRLFAAAAATDVEGGFPSQEFKWLHEAGLLTAALPVAEGGAGLGEPAALGLLLEVLRHVGRGNLAVGRLFEGHVNALLLIAEFGTPEQQQRYAADARAGHLFGVWNTEDPAHGVQLEERGKDGFVLKGAKTFASGSGHVTRPLLTAALPNGGGWQMLVLPADTQPPVLDRRFWRPLGMKATASFRADLTGLEIKATDLIGSPNSYYRQPQFGGGAVRFAAVQLGGAEAVYDETRRFLRALGRTDDPYQRQRLGQMALLLETGRHWLRGAAAHAIRPDKSAASADTVVAYANLTRTAVEQIGLDMLRLAERCVGARGLLQPEPFERMHRDLTHYLRQPAPDAVLADVGRFVLDGGNF